MGGSVASYYTGSFPDRVHRLALLEGLGPPESQSSVPGRVRGWLGAWRRVRESEQRTYPDLDQAAARLCVHDPLLRPELARELAERGTRPAEGGGVRFKHDPLHVTIGPTPFRLSYAAEFWSRITCPVLIVEGEQSSFRAAGHHAGRRERYFPSAEHTLLPGAGHMMQRHQPAALAELLVAFLTR
jgi:pimeloyl-ACP methyl ester carboxylesterase